jgi:hypothetical protein
MRASLRLSDEVTPKRPFFDVCQQKYSYSHVSLPPENAICGPYLEALFLFVGKILLKRHLQRKRGVKQAARPAWKNVLKSKRRRNNVDYSQQKFF